MSKPKQQQHESADGQAAPFAQLIGVINGCIEGAPQCITDRKQRSNLLVAASRAEFDAKRSSPRGLAAQAVVLVIRQHEGLEAMRAELQAVPARSDTDRGQAIEAVKCRRAALSFAELAHADLTAKHQWVSAQIDLLQSDRGQRRERVQAAVEDAERKLRNAIAADDATATTAAGDALSAARTELMAAAAAETHGPEAEVLAGYLRRRTEIEVEIFTASQRLESARDELKVAEERLASINMDQLWAKAIDGVLDEMFRIGKAGKNAPEKLRLEVPGASELRVPPLGCGLPAFLGKLYAPDYAALSVDLATLSDGNEPGPRVEFYDEVLTRAANRTAPKSYPPIPPRPGDRSPTVTYTDPAMRSAASVTQQEV